MAGLCSGCVRLTTSSRARFPGAKRRRFRSGRRTAVTSRSSRRVASRESRSMADPHRPSRTSRARHEAGRGTAMATSCSRRPALRSSAYLLTAVSRRRSRSRTPRTLDISGPRSCPTVSGFCTTEPRRVPCISGRWSRARPSGSSEAIPTRCSHRPEIFCSCARVRCSRSAST